MKKRMSGAALALQQTFWPVMAVIVVWSVLQGWSFLRSDVFWIQEYYDSPMAFEDVLGNHRVAWFGKFSFLMIFSMTLVVPKNKATYTLQRLRISENELTLGWALIFSGYYLLSWAVQLGLTVGMFRVFSNTVNQEAMDYFLACYRSRYLHLLLPLGEPWGYVRNIVICLGWGAMGALVSRYSRHGRKPIMAIALIVMTLSFLPQEMASRTLDQWLCGLTVIMIVIQCLMIREVERNED
jgi:hypothetical protein